MEIAVLILGFNRPRHTARVIEALGPASPSRVYVACDGPRDGSVRDRQLCGEVRHLLTNLPWACSICSRFLDRNVGCAGAVAGAIDWFFKQEESGVVLEDDCVPAATFLPYCHELLDRYRDDPRVMSVLGTRCAPPRPHEAASYSFSQFFNVWGWASWRRAWMLRQKEMGNWRLRLPGGRFAGSIGRHSVAGWSRKFDRLARESEPSTWDHQWTLTHFIHRGKCVLPRENLICNIGDGEDATHCRRANPWSGRLTGEVRLPLHHPAEVGVDHEADLHYERYRNNHRGFLSRKCVQVLASLGLGSKRWRRGGIE